VKELCKCSCRKKKTLFQLLHVCVYYIIFDLPT
jgi:hypothetical protein